MIPSYRIFYHPHAVDDINHIRMCDAPAAHMIVVVMSEIEGDQKLLQRLLEPRSMSTEHPWFSIDKWVEVFRQGYDLWRLRAYRNQTHGSEYRVIYAFDYRTRQFHVLAVAPRSFDYDISSALAQRILADYQALRQQ